MANQMDQNTCRLCNENIGVTSLFVSVDAGTQLSAIVMYCAKVTIVEGDGLPANICECCEDALKSAYRFILKCEQTDHQLRALQLALKVEHEVKLEHEVNLEHEAKLEKVEIEALDNGDDNFESCDNIFEDRCDFSPLDDIKEDVPEVRMKRKYVIRNVRKKRKKLGPIMCKICGRMCRHQSTLTNHMRTHDNVKPYTCPSCDKSYKDSGTLKRHIERNHNESRGRTVVCEQCGKSFFSKSDCKIHMRTHTGETPFACTKCPARFTQIGSLQRHTLTHTGERPHMCSKCSKNFPTRQQLKIHYLAHSDERKHKCPLCNVMFKTTNAKRKHLQRHTDGMTKHFTCDDCGQSFICKGNLRTHIQKLHSSKSGYCSKCSKHVPNLELHMWRHAGLRTVQCQFCPSSFFDLKGLARHVSFRHTSPEKFECTVKDCNIKFPSRPMLDYHVTRYHKAVKPFSCDNCPRSFYRKSDMVRHKKGTHKQFLEIPDTNKPRTEKIISK